MGRFTAIMRGLWRALYFRYSEYYAGHCTEIHKVGLKVLLSDEMREDSASEAESKRATGKILIDALDNYLFTNKGDVFSNIEISVEDDRARRGIEVAVMTEGAFPGKWLKYLPMPKFLWRQRVLNLDRWLPRQRNAIQEALKGVN